MFVLCIDMAGDAVLLMLVAQTMHHIKSFSLQPTVVGTTSTAVCTE